MKLTDAAIWDIEMGSTPPADSTAPSPSRAPYAAYEPAFTAMPWLHKAHLKVVDAQSTTGSMPQWIVLSDAEDPEVSLVLRLLPAGQVEVRSATRLQNEQVPGESLEPEGWTIGGLVEDPAGLIKAVGSPWGVGRRAGE